MEILKAKIISNVQVELLESIPEVINPSEKHIISSNWIRVQIDSLLYYIDDVFFAGEIDLEIFLKDIVEDLTNSLNTEVLVEGHNYKNCKLIKFSVKV